MPDREMTTNTKYNVDIISALAERTIRRLWVTIILLIVLFVGSNAMWIWYESQFVDEVVTQEVDTGDGDAIVAGIGDVIYGEDTADSKKADP